MNIHKSIKLFTIFIVAIIIITGCEVLDNTPGEFLLMHFIDVGQGDSTLIELPNGEVTLIDGGSRSTRDQLVKYLKDQNIEKIHYLIGTHPHEDHIGGLPEIIRNFEIGKIYLPNKTNNTAIFEELLNEIKKNNITLVVGKTGVDIINSGELKYYIISPFKEYEDINNNSIVTKLIYNNFSAIITGDAEKKAEIDILEGAYDLKANILKVGHHGSSTSNTQDFLDKIQPDFSVISLGKNNEYGHPHKEVVQGLEAMNTKILRTDEMGTIVFQTDGQEIKLLNKLEENEFEQNTEMFYIGNINTKIFHLNSCNSLPNKENQITFSSKETAIKQGYKPHSVCIE